MVRGGCIVGVYRLINGERGMHNESIRIDNGERGMHSGSTQVDKRREGNAQ